jgi:hypothetical protein
MGDRSPDAMYAKKGLKPPKPVRIAGGKELARVQISSEKNEVMGLIVDVAKMLKT